jgi:hypothetical protein
LKRGETTDQRPKAAHERGTDDTDEETRQISGRVHFANFDLPFISGIRAASVRGLSPLIRGRSPFLAGSFFYLSSTGPNAG